MRVSVRVMMDGSNSRRVKRSQSKKSGGARAARTSSSLTSSAFCQVPNESIKQNDDGNIVLELHDVDKMLSALIRANKLTNTKLFFHL